MKICVCICIVEPHLSIVMKQREIKDIGHIVYVIIRSDCIVVVVIKTAVFRTVCLMNLKIVINIFFYIKQILPWLVWVRGSI